MGLSFQKLEAVEFGDIVATPQLTTELKFRVQAGLEKAQTAEGMADLTANLAKAFGEKEEEVKAFIETNMTVNDIALLATYLLGGKVGVAKLQSKLGVEDES